MRTLTAALAALTFTALAACASGRPARPLELPPDAPKAPVTAAAPPAAEPPAPTAPAPAPQTEADRCVASCLAERKAAGDEQASEFWCVQDCNGGDDW